MLIESCLLLLMLSQSVKAQTVYCVLNSVVGSIVLPYCCHEEQCGYRCIGLATILTINAHLVLYLVFFINASKVTILVLPKNVYLFCIIFICISFKIFDACQIHYLKNQLRLKLLSSFRHLYEPFFLFKSAFFPFLLPR